MTHRVTIIVWTVLMLGSASASAQWTQFRGPRAGEVADDTALPDTWSETENVVWKIDIPGLSWSSPVVTGDHIFVTTAISAGEEPAPIPGLYDPGDDNGSVRASAEHRWVMYDIDFNTGLIRWQRELYDGLPQIGRHLKNSFASETPVTDGRRVYVYFGTVGLLTALNMSGETVWRTETGAFGSVNGFGSASSPVLHDDRLFVLNDNTTQSFFAAYDTNTGAQLWRTDRVERGGNWATPFVWEHELRTELVTSGNHAVRSYDLDGNLLWQLQGMSSLSVPTPFAKNGLVYLSSGYPGGGLRPMYAVRPGASGDISLWPPDVPGPARTVFSGRFPGERATSEHVAWAYPLLGTYNTTALVHGDIYYTLLDRGFLLAHDARTGEEIYGRQRIEIGNGFTASPWAYNDKIFLLSEDGDTFVVRAGPEFEILHKNSLNEMSLATPAIARGSVIIRTQSKLYRIANDGTAGS